MTRKTLYSVSVAALCWALILTGCKISKEGGNGEDKRVSIEAPGASMHVDTATANDSGLPVYPGAQVKQKTGDDKNTAHVKVNLPFMKLNVVALKFTSDDPPEKILVFYRSKLSGYGSLIECKGAGQDVEVGSKRGLDSAVTCSKEHGDASETSLKVGTEGNQHVVSVKPNGKGSEFELVYVQLGGKKGDDDYAGKEPS